MAPPELTTPVALAVVYVVSRFEDDLLVFATREAAERFVDAWLETRREQAPKWTHPPLPRDSYIYEEEVRS